MQPDLPGVRQATSLSWAISGLFSGNWKAASSAVACLRLWPGVPVSQSTRSPQSYSPPKREVRRSTSFEFVSLISASSSETCAADRSPSQSLQAPFSSVSLPRNSDISTSLSLRRTFSISANLQSRKAVRRSAVAAAAAGDLNAARDSDPGTTSRGSAHKSRWQHMQNVLPTLALALAALSCGGLAVTAGCSRLLRCLLAYGALEFAFQAWQQQRYAMCNLMSEDVPDAERIPLIKKRFMALHGVIDIRDFLSGWFHGAPFEDLRHGNIQDFVAYGFYCSAYRALPILQRQATDSFIEEVSATWDVSFPEGFNPAVAPMTHLWEPLRVGFKPLVVHLASEACGTLTRLLLHLQGYTRLKHDGFAFWIRYPRTRGTTGKHAKGGDDEPANAHPLVFLHGVGWGLMPYLHFVDLLSKAAPHAPVIVVEVPHLALRVSGQPRSVDDVAHATAAVLELHGFSAGACLVGHSYGTFAVSRICQLYPQAVHSMALLDPVCLMTCAPGLLTNFVYKLPEVTWRNATSAEGMMDAARALASRDLLIAASFCRNFHWHELMLWPEDMEGAKAIVVLSFNDDLVPVHQVIAQMKEVRSVELITHPSAGHGGFLMDQQFQGRIAAAVAHMMLDSEDQ